MSVSIDGSPEPDERPDERSAFVDPFSSPAELAWISKPGSLFGVALGAAWLITYGWVDSGNLMAAVSGSRGMSLGANLAVLLLGGLLCFFAQTLAVRLGAYTREDLASAARDAYGPGCARLLWMVGEASVVAAELQEMLIGASALECLLGLPLAGGVAVLALDTFTFSALAHFSKAGAHLLGAITLMMLALCGSLPWLRSASPPPRVQSVDIMSLANTAGALLMPYNLVLHSAMAAQVVKATPRGMASPPQIVRRFVSGTAIALASALAINFFVVVTFSGTDIPDTNAISLQTAVAALGAPSAKRVFACVVLVSAVLGPVVYTLAGQIMCQGFMNLRVQSWRRAIIVRLLIIGPAMIIALATANGGDQATLNDAVNSVQVLAFPLFLAPLLRLSPMSIFERVSGLLMLSVFLSLTAMNFANRLASMTNHTTAVMIGATCGLAYMASLAWLLLGGSSFQATARATVSREHGLTSARFIAGRETQLRAAGDAELPPEGSPQPAQDAGYEPPATVFTVVLALLAMIGGLLFGYDLGVVSGALPLISEEWGLSATTEEVIVSTLLFGALLGSPLGGLLCDLIGRRFALLLSATLLWQGIVFCAFAPDLKVMLLGRFLAGLAVGVESLALPLYVRELALPKARGRFVALNELAIAAGMLVAFVADYLLSASRNWRWMLGLAAIPGAVQWMACAVLPESPRWLLSAGHPTATAEQVLLDVRSPGCWLAGASPSPRVEAFVREEVRATLAECRETGQEQASLGALLGPNIRSRLGVGLGLCLFQQLTGQPTMIYYASDIFRMAGFRGNTAANAASISLGIAKMVATGGALVIIERVGRKGLLIAGQLGMCLGALALTIVFGLGDDGGAARGSLAVVGLVIFVGSFSVGYGPVTWVVLTELFPTSLRGRAMSVGVAVNWLANALVSLTFLSIIKALGQSLTFAGYTVIGVVALLFCWRCVPETRGSMV